MLTSYDTNKKFIASHPTIDEDELDESLSNSWTSLTEYFFGTVVKYPNWLKLISDNEFDTIEEYMLQADRYADEHEALLDWCWESPYMDCWRSY